MTLVEIDTLEAEAPLLEELAKDFDALLDSEKYSRNLRGFTKKELRKGSAREAQRIAQEKRELAAQYRRLVESES